MSAIYTSVITSMISRFRAASDRGQATAEYALVILGAAAMAILVISWASSTSAVSDLLDRVINSVASRVA